MFKSLISLLPLKFRDKYRAAWYNAELELSIITGKLVRYLRRPKTPNNIDGSINLHLGCGNINNPAFINIDLVPAPHIHYVSRIDHLHQFRDNSIDLIYACHCLEHFSHMQTLAVLKEWCRVLKKNGILRVSVPDFNSMVELYLTAGRDINKVLYPITGNQDYKYNFHMSIFNEESLRRLFIDAGFSVVKRWTPGSSAMTTFDDWSGRTITLNNTTFPISLNLETFK